MKKICFLLVCITLLSALAGIPTAALGEMSWYCTRQKAHRQAIAAPELRFAEEYGAYYIDHAHNEAAEERVVYLTFDMGYENENVEKILDTLQKEEVSAAFFVLKHPVEHSTDLLERMAREGHLICNHTATHPDLSCATPERIKAEITELERVCKEAGIPLSPYFRPPEGRFSKQMLECVRSLGYKTVFWSFAYADWDNQRQPSADKALRCIMDNVHNGAVLLLHPTSATNAEVLPQVIKQLKADGYRFGTLHQLCGT